jgi:hypothetical protein
MSLTPWTNFEPEDGLWIPKEDRRRVDRANAELAPDDPRKLHYRTVEGRALYPGQWSGNPWRAEVVLLLLNPAFSLDLDRAYTNESFSRYIEPQVRGQWDAEYPNPWVRPEVRDLDPWSMRVAFADIHKKLVSLGGDAENSWKTISKKIAILELSPWASFRWSPSAYTSTTRVSIQLAFEASRDPGRQVLLGRGLDDWRAAGLLDADLLPRSRGIRQHQSRISESNFPTAWSRILDLVAG